MKSSLSFILLFLLIISAYGQEFPSDFKTVTINKQLNQFPDQFDLSSPLASFVTFNYTFINGKDKLLRIICSIKHKSLLPDSTASDSQVSEEVKKLHLYATINQVIIYKDSISFVISHMIGENKGSYYSIRSFYVELGKWVNNGEDLCNDIRSARRFIINRAEIFFEDFQQIQKKFY
jgi:hypothetical protein